jgi:hypothetical protein
MWKFCLVTCLISSLDKDHVNIFQRCKDDAIPSREEGGKVIDVMDLVIGYKGNT